MAESFLDRIDGWILKRHQDVVELSQKQPSWLVEQAAIVMLILSLLKALLRPQPLGPWEYFSILTAMVLAGGFIYVSKTPAMLSMIARDQVIRLIRISMMVMTLIVSPLIIFAIFIGGEPTRDCLKLAHDIAFLSMYYFAMCHPPTPKEDKRFVFNS